MLGHVVFNLDAGSASAARRERSAEHARALRLPRLALCAVTGSVPTGNRYSQRTPYRLRRSHGTGLADRRLSRDSLIRLIDFPELLFRAGLRETIKAGRTTLMVRAELPIAGRLQPIAYKRVRRKTLLKKVTSLWRANRVAHCFQMGRRLRRLGIATPRPLAAVVPRRRTAWQPSYLAVEWISGARNARRFLEDFSSDWKTLRQAAERLGVLIGRMHAAGISHRDLKAGNILLRLRNRRVEVWVIDLDAARTPLWLTSAARLRNLRRLAAALSGHPAATQSLTLRFLKSYLVASGDGLDAWKSRWRQLAGARAA